MTRFLDATWSLIYYTVLVLVSLVFLYCKCCRNGWILALEERVLVVAAVEVKYMSELLLVVSTRSEVLAGAGKGQSLKHQVTRPTSRWAYPFYRPQNEP